MCSTNSFPGSPFFAQKCTPSSLPSSKILPQDYWTLLGKHKKSWDPRGPMIWDNFSIFRANCAILTSYIYACVVVSRVDVVTLRDQILRIARLSCGIFTAMAWSKEPALFYVLLCSQLMKGWVFRVELTNRMWFSVVYSFIDNDTRHQSGQNVVDSRGAAERVRNKFWPIKLYTTLNHIRFVFYHNSNGKENVFFSERDQDRDTKKEQALSITFSQSDWFILQNERFWLAITTSKSYHKNSESSDKNESWTLNSRKYNFNCSVTANIQAEFSMMTAAKRTHWHLQWCSHGRSHLGRPKHWSLRQSTKSNLKLASLEHE